LLRGRDTFVVVSHGRDPCLPSGLYIVTLGYFGHIHPHNRKDTGKGDNTP
jgi:hypothetical protein